MSFDFKGAEIMASNLVVSNKESEAFKEIFDEIKKELHEREAPPHVCKTFLDSLWKIRPHEKANFEKVAIRSSKLILEGIKKRSGKSLGDYVAGLMHFVKATQTATDEEYFRAKSEEIGKV